MTFEPIIDSETITPAMAERRAALSRRTVEEPEAAPTEAVEFTADIAPFGPVAGYRPLVVSRAALEAQGLAKRAPETPIELPPEWRDRKILPSHLSPFNPNLTAEERERNALLLERGGGELIFMGDLDEEEEKPAKPAGQRRVVLTASMAGQMTEEEIDDWIERHS
jgi:hypothetical protein